MLGTKSLVYKYFLKKKLRHKRLDLELWNYHQTDFLITVNEKEKFDEKFYKMDFFFVKPFFKLFFVVLVFIELFLVELFSAEFFVELSSNFSSNFLLKFSSSFSWNIL